MRLAATALMLAAALAASPAAAQEPAEPDTTKPLIISFDLGYVNASGNTDISTLNIGEDVRWRRQDWKWTQGFTLVNGSTDGEETANLVTTFLRGDWLTTDRLSVYGLVNYDRNKFGGISWRFDEGLGLAYQILNTAHQQLDGDLGAQLVQQRSIAGVDDNFAAGRVAATYRLLILEGSYFLEALEYLPSLEDGGNFRVNNETALVAPLARQFALKLSYLVRFNNRPPEPEFDKSDRFFTAGVQISF